MAACAVTDILPCSGNGVCDPDTLQCVCKAGFGAAGDMLAQGLVGCQANQTAILVVWVASLVCASVTFMVSVHRSWVTYQILGRKTLERDVPQFQVLTIPVAALMIAASALRVSGPLDELVGLSPASTYVYFVSCVGIMLYGYRIVYIFYHAVARKSAFNTHGSSKAFKISMMIVLCFGSAEFAMPIAHLYVSPSQGQMLAQAYIILMGITSAGYALIVMAFTSKVLTHLKSAVKLHHEMAHLLFGLQIVRGVMLFVPLIIGSSSIIISALLPDYPVMIAYKLGGDYLFMAIGVSGISSFLAFATSTESSHSNSKSTSKDTQRGSRSTENPAHPAGSLVSLQLSAHTQSPLSEQAINL